MKKYQLLGLIFVFAALIIMNGCLTVQEKEYNFQINADGSGKGTIKFVNIVSEEDEEKDVSFKDFGELIDSYIEGDQFEQENPYYNVTEKKIYEENGVLMGEVTFTFDDADSIGFYKDETCNCAPYIYYLGSLSETFAETNGTYLGETNDFPLITWTPDTKKFYFKTIVKEDMSDAHSLLPLYKTWKENQ